MPPKRKAAAKKPKPLEDWVICLTGTFTKKRADLIDLIEQAGGTVSTTVTQACTHVAFGTRVGADKQAEAKRKGKTILTEDELEDAIAGKAPSSAKKDKDEKDEDPEPPAKKQRVASAAAAKAAAAAPEPEEKAEAAEPAEPAVTKKLTKKGRGVVDEHSGMVGKAHVYEEPDCVWQCTLNQTNIGQNNNKFYIIQLLQADDNPNSLWVWTRWARVGLVGQSKLDRCSNLIQAKSNFQKKFSDKTSNAWANREKFNKIPGKYHLMAMDYGDEEVEETKTKLNEKLGNLPDSKLARPVQDLMNLICDVGMMQNALKELEIDTRKMPLGKIQKKQVKEGYEILSQIDKELQGKGNRAKLEQLSSMFYTLIPHDFGMRMPPLIDTQDLLKKKTDLLHTLNDLEIATKLLESAKGDENPTDANYKKLNCYMEAMDKTSDEYKLLVDYVANTHGETHTTYKLEVLDILRIKRGDEEKRFEKYEKLDNHMLLWHGSRLTNWMGILSQGLRIAPPEAPVTGYMFGKGVYFADMVTKSGNYCCTNREKNVGVMLLSEVALGNMHRLRGASYMEKAPAGFQSTMGEGRNAPDPKGNVTVGGYVVPAGKSHNTGLDKASSLLYNEFIVYDEAQVKMRYLFRMRFNYRS